MDAYGTCATYPEGVGVLQAAGASVLSASEGKTTSKSKNVHTQTQKSKAAKC
jgi:hypothetical protein